MLAADTKSGNVISRRPRSPPNIWLRIRAAPGSYRPAAGSQTVWRLVAWEARMRSVAALDAKVMPTKSAP